MRPMRSRVYLVRGRGRVRIGVGVRVRAIFRPIGSRACLRIDSHSRCRSEYDRASLTMAILTRGVPEQE